MSILKKSPQFVEKVFPEQIVGGISAGEKVQYIVFLSFSVNNVHCKLIYLKM